MIGSVTNDTASDASTSDGIDTPKKDSNIIESNNDTAIVCFNCLVSILKILELAVAAILVPIGTVNPIVTVTSVLDDVKSSTLKAKKNANRDPASC